MLLEQHGAPTSCGTETEEEEEEEEDGGAGEIVEEEEEEEEDGDGDDGEEASPAFRSQMKHRRHFESSSYKQGQCWHLRSCRSTRPLHGRADANADNASPSCL